MSLQVVGQRLYFSGNTFPIKDKIKALGAHWDADRKQWWVGAAKRAEAEALIATLATTPASPSGTSTNRTGDGDRTVVAGKATYKGRTAYIVGRVARGRTHWDDRVTPVTTRDGAKILLASMDGSRTWWAPQGAAQIIKTYDKPRTIAGLRRFAERLRNGDVETCGYCGSPACDGARGGHCEED